MISMHILFFYFSLVIIEFAVLTIFGNSMTDRLIVLLAHCLYSVIYFTLVWKGLYSFTYHYFTNNGISVVMRMTMISALMAVIFIFVMFIINAGSINGYSDASLVRESIIVIIVDMVMYFILFAGQFLWVNNLIKIGFIGKNVLFIGNPDERIPVQSMLENTSHTRFYSGRIIYRDNTWHYADKAGNESATTVNGILDLICSLQIGEIFIFIGGDVPKDSIYDLVEYCRRMSIGYYLIPDLEKLSKREFWARMFPYVPFIECYIPMTDSLIRISMKRILDLFIVTCLLPVLIPLFAVLAIAIKLEDGGPVFYVGKRVGRNGKLIDFYKFRSMRVDSESKQKDLFLFNERRDGPLFKMTNDPRLTKIGKIIRKYNIDELPQMLNVLKGEMSIAGPRPHLAAEVAEYSPRDLIRLESIPGITCYPQIINDFKMGFREWVDLDLYYRKKWSLKIDLKIIVALFMLLVCPSLIRKFIQDERNSITKTEI
jgi:lipopolysaccharide/colanic/teichoic acid biosynthesis glycosyltransferase